MDNKLFSVYFYKNKYDLVIQFLQLGSIVTLSFCMELIGIYLFPNEKNINYPLEQTWLYAFSLFPLALYKSFYLDIILDKTIEGSEKKKLSDNIIYFYILFFLISILIITIALILYPKISPFIIPNLLITLLLIFYNRYLYKTKNDFLDSFSNSILFIALIITFNSILVGYSIINNEVNFYYIICVIYIVFYIISSLAHNYYYHSISEQEKKWYKKFNVKNILFSLMFITLLYPVLFNKNCIDYFDNKIFEIFPYIFYITLPMIVVESFWYVRGKTNSDLTSLNDNYRTKMYRRIIDLVVYRWMVFLPLLACISLNTTKSEGGKFTMFIIYIALYYLLQIITYFIFSKIFPDEIKVNIFGNKTKITREHKWKLIELSFGFLPIIIYLLLTRFDKFISNGKISNTILEIDFSPLNAVSILTTVFILIQLINVLILPNDRDAKPLEKFAFTIFFSVIIILFTSIVKFDTISLSNSDLPIKSMELINEKGKLLAIIYSIYLITITALIFYANIRELKKIKNQDY